MLTMLNDHPIVKILNKKEKLAIGLMSGTSMDGVDVALVKISGFSLNTEIELVAFKTYPYPQALKNKLLAISRSDSGTTQDICTLNAVVGEYFLDAALGICSENNLPIDKVDLIATHGQTVQHLPQKRNLYDKDIRCTLQIGDPAIIAARTGVVTIGLFRNNDVAVDGEGAPLVPYFDYVFFRDENKNRVLLNIGGIANVTLLKKNCQQEDVIAFDTGPGNMVVDGLMQHFYHRSYDHNGEIAQSGNISHGLLEQLLAHPYFSLPAPKSTGREMFGEKFIGDIIAQGSKMGLKSNDIIATATELTAITIKKGIETHFEEKVDELIVSGGGVFNKTLMNSLRQKFNESKVMESGDFGIPSDAKEAICFAVLGNECVHGVSANLPAVTGANKKTILGAIFLG